MSVITSSNSRPWESVHELFSAWTACAAELSAFYHDQLAELESLRQELADSARRVAALHADACQQREAAEARARQIEELTQRVQTLEHDLQAAQEARRRIEAQAAHQREQHEQALREAAAQQQTLQAALEAARAGAADAEVVEQLRAALQEAQQEAEGRARRLEEAESLVRRRDDELQRLQQQVDAWQAKYDELQRHSAEERSQWASELKVLRRALEMQAEARTATRPAEASKPRATDRVVDAVAARLSQLQSGRDAR